MPYPHKGESKKAYIARFMESGEAKSDFPDEKQRLAVAYSMFEKRNASGTETPWPKMYEANFIEPGVVFYQDLGPCKVCGNAMTCAVCDTEGETVLVKQEALAKMAKSFLGKPVVDLIHKDVTPSFVADGEADGIVTDVWFDDKTGWWKCKYLVWNPETQEHCESPAYSVSCAYEPTNVGGEGTYHNLDYQEEILDGMYTHLAVVTNPRYEGARIQIVNSKGGRMSWKFWEKGARKNAADLDPLKESVDVDGKQVPLQHLYDALGEEEEAKKPKLNDDTVMETKHGEKTLKELKQAYRNKLAKNAALEEEKRKNADPEKMSHDELRQAYKDLLEEKKNAEAKKEPIVEEKLPDMRDEKHNDQAEEAAKKLDAGAKEEAPLKLEQEGDLEARHKQFGEKGEDAAKREAAALDKKNSEDNFDEAEATAKKNADDEKKLEEKRNAGKKSFAALRNAVHERMTDPVTPSVVSIDDRLARGKAKYGKTA